MYTYNITIKVAQNISEAWLKWMQEIHIPALMNTGCFTGYKFMQLLNVDDSEGPTYVAQYFCNTMQDYDNYINNFAALLKQESYKNWGDAFIAFRTVMVEV